MYYYLGFGKIDAWRIDALAIFPPIQFLPILRRNQIVLYVISFMGEYIFDMLDE